MTGEHPWKPLVRLCPRGTQREAWQAFIEREWQPMKSYQAATGERWPRVVFRFWNQCKRKGEPLGPLAGLSDLKDLETAARAFFGETSTGTSSSSSQK